MLASIANFQFEGTFKFYSQNRTRNAVIGHKDFDLTYLEEAYTSEHWLVRIYRLVQFAINFIPKLCFVTWYLKDLLLN